MSDGVERVAVCIASTRPDGLRGLLASLDQQDAPAAEIRLVVVDNTPDARVVASGPASRWPIEVHELREPSISGARNLGIRAAVPWASVIALVDDDEVVPRGWVAAGLDALRSASADVATGPVHHVGDEGAAAAQRPGERIHRVFTNNTFVDTDVFRAHERWFDPRLGLTGGEDKEFFQRVLRSGAVAVTTGVAVSTQVPDARRTIRYVTSRAYARGNVDGLVDRWGGSSRAAALRAAVGLVVALLLAVPAAILAPTGTPWARHRINVLARRAGWLVGRNGVAYEVYGSGHRCVADVTGAG